MSVPARSWRPADEARARTLVDRAATMRPASPIRMPVQHFMVRDGCDYSGALDERHGFVFTNDVIMLPTHGTTHIVAISHVLHEGRIYSNPVAVL